MENLPFNQNINWTVAGGAVVTLFAYFFPGIPDNVRNAILTLALVALIIIVPYLHTFINHPANQAKAIAIVDRAVSSAKQSSSVLAVCLVTALILSSVLSGCAAAPAQDPRTILTETEATFAIAEATYDSICSVYQSPSFCTSPAAVKAYGDAKQAIEAAFQTADAAIAASNNLDSAAIEQLLAAVSNDWVTYLKIVNGVQAQNAHLKGIPYHPLH